MLYQKMLSESQKLKEQILFLEQEISKLPDGKIFCVNDKNRIKWFHSDGKNHTYIPKKERSYAELLAYKKYLLQVLADCQHEDGAIEFYLRHHDENMGQSVQNLLSQPAYQELLSPVFKPLSKELDQWMHEPYEKNQSYPENLIFPTSSGNIVRSKSEVMIDMYLYTNRIPFRYECALDLGGYIIYPDFTIRHPVTGETYYYEHFGMMDEWEYRKKALEKLDRYIKHQIIPGVRLLITFETSQEPLKPKLVEDMIRHYFL